ncbi:MAG: hypothetical protein ACO35C_05370 [Pontimonas sp.]
MSRYSDDLKKVMFQCSSNQVLEMFFSASNIERLQSQMRIIIKEKMGVIIDRQSDTELVQVMRAMYAMRGNPRPDDVAAEVRRLNGIVLEWVIPHITVNIRAHIGYLRDISQPYRLLERPKYASLKGEQTVQLFPTRN